VSNLPEPPELPEPIPSPIPVRPDVVSYPSTPPRTRLDLPPAGPGSAASVLMRVGARLIDVVLLWIAPAVILLAPFVPDSTDKNATIDFATVDSWRIVIMVMTFPVVDAVMTTLTGRSPGKFLLGLRVVRYVDGRLAAPYQVVLRTAVVAIPFVAPLVLPSTIGQFVNLLSLVVLISIAIDPVGRGFQDKAGGTIVLRTR